MRWPSWFKSSASSSSASSSSSSSSSSSRCSLMAPRLDSLEEGYWQGGKPDGHVSRYARLARRTLDLVQPAFLVKQTGRSRQLRRTAWLDGLRGFAAFLVYWGHHQLFAHEAIKANRIFENGYGYDKQYYFACLPGIRTFFSGGHYAVTIFFVISGYVLSAKPMSLIHAGDHTKLADNLASALFRRWPRLYIPVICTTFAYMTAWHGLGLWTDTIPRSNYYEEVWNYYVEFKNFSFVFRLGGDPWFTYNFHTWSIPVEFRGSIAVYTALLALSRCRRNARLWCQAGLIVYLLYIVDGSFTAMFISGMMLCDIDLLADAANDGDGHAPRFFTTLKPFGKIIFPALFVISLLLGGVPHYRTNVEALMESPGWNYLAWLKPQAVFDYKWFYLFWAATFLVLSIPRISWLKTFFECRFNQYLGRISFAFYLVHGPVMWILGDRLYAATGWSRESHAIRLIRWINLFPLPKSGPLGLELSFLVPHLIILPVTFWLAEMVTKLVDTPSVKLTQWLYAKTLEPPVVKSESYVT